MNKKVRSLTQREFNNFCDCLLNGFNYVENGNKKTFRPKPEIYLIVLIQAKLGLKLSKVLELKLKDIEEGNLYNILTVNKFYIKVPEDLVSLIVKYCEDNNINEEECIIKVKENVIRKHIKTISDYLGYENVSSESFRKLFASKVLEKTDDIKLLNVMLNHKHLKTTRKYLDINNDKVNAVIENLNK